MMELNGTDSTVDDHAGTAVVYEFGQFRLDTSQRILTRLGEPIRLKLKTFELLEYLVRNSNEVVEKNRLMRAVWQDSFVEDANLTVQISNLRKVFSNGNGDSITIETFPKVGYRFNADVRVVGGNGQLTSRIESEREIPSNESVDQPNAPAARRWLVGWGIICVTAVLIGGALLANWLWGFPNRTQTMTRVPGTEQSSSIALSPNGEYLAHAVSVAGKRTLLITHINSGSSVQLLPPDEELYYGMTFSPDNNYLHFIKSGPDFNTLYKIPILGGNITKILDRVGTRISFSPDGSRFCFVRKLPGDVTALLTAKADGSDEVEIARRTSPEYYSSFDISWSPDGKLIAAGAGTHGNNPKSQIVGISVDNGTETNITEKRWAGIDGVEWLRDGTGLVAGLFEGPTSKTHVWLVPFPSGEPVKITNDLENYGSVGVSADGAMIMAGQFKDNTSVWVVPAGAPDQAYPVRTGKHHRFQWVRWMPGGEFIFGSDASKNRDVWRMKLDGSDERQLTNGPQSNVMPVATQDGRYVVFAAFRDNNGLFELWRMNPDGSDQVRLTSGGGAWQPSLTPDGKWAFYTSGKMGGPEIERQVWKVPVDGGSPVRFVDGSAFGPDISPDGKFVVCWVKENETTKAKLAIFAIEGGTAVKFLNIPAGARIGWTPDGKGLSYIKTEGDISNIWTQPIDGGPSKLETNFRSESITNFDWSNDNRLLLSRFNKTRDVMLIRNFR